ncbi:hypothetical protein [Bradyrhizobium sp. UFLA05-112]
MRLSRKLRKLHYYSVPAAGALIGWSRSESYRAAERNDIPTEEDGSFLWVPKRMWDQRVAQFLRGPHAKRRSRPHKSTQVAAAEPNNTA